MKSLLKKENFKTLIFTTAYLIIGLMLCISPLKMYNFMESALCFVMLIAGIVCIFIYSLMSSDDKILKLLFYGIVGMSLGIVTILFPKVFAVILSLIISYTGISLIVSSLKDRKRGNSWIPDLVVGIIVSVLSIATLVLVGTSAAKRILAIFFGIILLINGIYGVVSLVKIVKQSKNPVNLDSGESETKDSVVDEIQETDTQEEQISKEAKKEESSQEEKVSSEEVVSEKKKIKTATRKNYRKAKKKK